MLFLVHHEVPIRFIWNNMGVTSIENIFQVQSERLADFSEFICHKENALRFLNTYTPIAVADEDVEQGSEPSCAETRR